MKRTLVEQLLVSMAVPATEGVRITSINDLDGIYLRSGLPERMAGQMIPALRSMGDLGYIEWSAKRAVLTPDGLSVRETALGKENPDWFTI